MAPSKSIFERDGAGILAIGAMLSKESFQAGKGISGDRRAKIRMLGDGSVRVSRSRSHSVAIRRAALSTTNR